MNNRHYYFFWCLYLLRHIFYLGIIAAMSLITLGLRLVNLKGVFRLNIFTPRQMVFIY